MPDEEEVTYADVLQHLFGQVIREATYQAQTVSDLTPELAVAALIRAWRVNRDDQIIGADELETALALANGAPADELTDDRTIGEQHLRDVVDPPAGPRPAGLTKRLGMGNGNGLFRA